MKNGYIKTDKDTANIFLKQGRYLLFLDILGFSQLVETKSVEEISIIIDKALSAFEKWEKLNKLFKVIYFSDSFVFYQEPKGYGDWAFLDIYAIGGMILSALLAEGIPARGAISFGEFEVKINSTNTHQVYFGKALVEAYKAEQKENWIGITILESAWKPYEDQNKGIIETFEFEHVWKKRHDNVLMLNPLVKLHGWYEYDLIGEVDRPYMDWDAPNFPNDILAFKFLRDQAQKYSKLGNFSDSVSGKYHSTIAFLKEVLGKDIYQWGIEISEEANRKSRHKHTNSST